MKNFRFQILVSKSAYNHKPSSDDMRRMHFIDTDTDIDGLMRLIESGHTLRNRIRKKGKENAYVVMIDIDDCLAEPQDFINALASKPTLAYTTPSDGKDGYRRFRLLYVFDTPINDHRAFSKLYSSIVQSNSIRTKDNCGRNINQCFHGNGTESLQWLHEGHLWHIDDFSASEQRDTEQEVAGNEHSVKATKTAYQLDKDFSELLRKNRKEFLSKYSYLTAPTSSNGILHPSGLCYIHDQGHYAITRSWEDGVDGKKKIHRWADGEERRKKLFVAARILLTITPALTLEELTYNLALELSRSYDNTKDTITSNELIAIAARALNSDWLPTPTGKKFSINKDVLVSGTFATTRELTARARKVITDDRIGNLYDTSLTPHANYKMMKKMGLSVSKGSVYRFARENGLAKNVTGTFPPSCNKNTPLNIIPESGNPETNPIIEEYIAQGFKSINEAWKNARDNGIELGMGRNKFRQYCIMHHRELINSKMIRR